MQMMRIASLGVLGNGRYNRRRGVSPADITRAAWQKSSLSAYNGSCFEIARLRGEQIGVRDTKDCGAGPILVFNQQEWDAFVGGVKAGEFDSV